jgi:Tfp pilus assembly protein PilN
MLAELSRRMPSRVWLTSVEEKDHKMTLSGAGLSYDDVSEFMRALRESGYFKNVQPKQQEERPSPIPGMNFVVFSVTCDTKYTI